MDWVVMGVVGAIAAVVVNMMITARHRKKAEAAQAAADAAAAPKKKRKKKPVESDATAPAAPAQEAPVIPSTWGWAKVHLKAADLKALGYYYRDRQAGPSFKVLVDLLADPTEDVIRREAAEKRYIANSTFRLGAHETLYAGAREGEMAALTLESYEKGEGASGPACAVVMMLTADEKRAYGLPAAMPNIEVYLS